MNRYSVVRRAIALLLAAVGVGDACAGTSQAACNAPSYVSVAASNGTSAIFFLTENEAATMGAAVSGNLVFSMTGNGRFRSAKVAGTNSAFTASTPTNGARILTTAGNGNAALPSAAAGTGQIVFGGVTFNATYLVDAGADTLVISNDAGVAPTAVDSAAATAGSDLSYGECLAGLMKAFNSVFASPYYSATVPATGGGTSGLFSYTDPSATAPATLTLDRDVAIAGGTSLISITGGLAAVTVTANVVPGKYIDADGKLVVPFNYAPGARNSLVALSNIVLDTRDVKKGDSLGVQLDPATTTSGVTAGVITNIVYTADINPFTSRVTTIPNPGGDCGSIGPKTNRTQVVAMPFVLPSDVGKRGKYYVGARLSDGRLYFLNGMGDFVPYTGGDIPEWGAGALSNGQYVLALSNADVSSIVGTQIYAGYGANADEMVRNGTYSLAVTVR